MEKEFREQPDATAEQRALVQALTAAVDRADRETLVQTLTEALDQADEDALMQDLADALERSAEEPLAEASEADGKGRFDLPALIFYVLGKAKYIILAALLGVLLAGLYARFFIVPQYEATSKLYIVNSSGVQISMSDLRVAANLTYDYQEIFKTWEIHEMVRSDLDLTYSDSEFRSMLTVSNPDDTHLLYITIRHTNPVEAMQIANAYARSARTFIYQVMGGIEPTEFSIALVPSTAVTQSRDHHMLIGSVAGAALMIVLFALGFLMDDRPHTPDDITAVVDVPTLAVVPREKVAGTKRRNVRRQ